MSVQDEIVKAIGAHGLWKGRLMTAINTGKSEFEPAKVCLDNQCDFGRWLYGATLLPKDKTNPQYEVVRKLHGEFHKIAGNVLTLALQGKKEQALALVADGSPFAKLSVELTQAMMKWKASAA